jgi:hypothetical protein
MGKAWCYQAALVDICYYDTLDELLKNLAALSLISQSTPIWMTPLCNFESGADLALVCATSGRRQRIAATDITVAT